MIKTIVSVKRYVIFGNDLADTHRQGQVKSQHHKDTRTDRLHICSLYCR
jgi:hypothetical protein